VNLNYRKLMECLSANKLPIGDRWTYEIKLDGFRLEAVRTESRVILYSKQGKLLTSQFMQVALELEKLPCDTVIDGELVALDGGGVPRFNLLQNYRAGSAHLMYFAFDTLLLKGRDVTKLPLSDRPGDLLRSVVKRGKHIDLAEWSDKLEALERFAREHRLEGSLPRGRIAIMKKASALGRGPSSASTIGRTLSSVGSLRTAQKGSRPSCI